MTLTFMKRSDINGEGAPSHILLQPRPSLVLSPFPIPCSPRNFRTKLRQASIRTLLLAFHTKELRSQCESGALAEATLGYELSQSLKNSLLYLRDAANANELVAAGVLEIDTSEFASISLRAGRRLILQVGNGRHRKPNGTVDWSRVTRMKVLSIEGGDGE